MVKPKDEEAKLTTDPIGPVGTSVSAGDRAHAFENPQSPVSPLVPPSTTDPVGPPAPAPGEPRAPGQGDVFWHPTPEQAAEEKRNAQLANEKAGITGEKKKLSTEQRLDRLESILRSQGHDV